MHAGHPVVANTQSVPDDSAVAQPMTASSPTSSAPRNGPETRRHATSRARTSLRAHHGVPSSVHVRPCLARPQPPTQVAPCFPIKNGSLFQIGITFSVFQCLPLFRHALFPSGFRLQVNRMTQEQPSGLLLTESGIQHRVPRRTLSPHTALQWPDFRRSALGISPTLLPTPVHLTRFAMWPAFPASDSYQVSVAMGLAPWRRSRISPMSYVRAWFRSSTHPYAQDRVPGISSCGPAVPASSSDRHTMTSRNQLVGSIPW